MTRDDWERQLDDNPEDWQLRLVYGDWLEEQGVASECLAQRFMGIMEKRPSTCSGGILWSAMLPNDNNPTHSELPLLVWENLHSIWFTTRIHAEEAIANVFRHNPDLFDTLTAETPVSDR